jgi:hypothetical protein
MVRQRPTLPLPCLRRFASWSADSTRVQERLKGARSNLRFADKRIADLETQLLELQQTAR